MQVLEKHKPQAVGDTPLRFPGKLAVDEAGDRLFIADSSNHRIVVTSLDGQNLLSIGGIGAGMLPFRKHMKCSAVDIMHTVGNVKVVMLCGAQSEYRKQITLTWPIKCAQSSNYTALSSWCHMFGTVSCGSRRRKLLGT